jgi:hypothetical protein
MIRATIDVNGVSLSRLTCQNISGPLRTDWCRYLCRYTDTQTGERHEFEVSHNREDGAPALLATAFGMLAEAGVGRRAPAQVTNWEEE